MTVFLYVSFLLVGVMLSSMFILFTINLIIDLGKPGNKHESIYGDCPCCENPIVLCTDGDIDISNSDYIEYRCTKCNWISVWRKNEVTNRWKKVI